MEQFSRRFDSAARLVFHVQQKLSDRAEETSNAFVQDLVLVSELEAFA
jgi:Txe/YoeB family toxin of Txe-Axe toxin-antitoxin module